MKNMSELGIRHDSGMLPCIFRHVFIGNCLQFPPERTLTSRKNRKERHPTRLIKHTKKHASPGRYSHSSACFIFIAYLDRKAHPELMVLSPGLRLLPIRGLSVRKAACRGIPAEYSWRIRTTA